MHPLTKRLYWQLTALLLAAHFAQWRWGLPLAIALGVVQVVHVIHRRRSLRPLDVQVRLAWLGLLGIGTQPGLWPLHAIQFVGVNALMVADYCLLARLLVLLPWNRTVPLSLRLLVWLLTAPPAPGAITTRLHEAMGCGAQAAG